MSLQCGIIGLPNVGKSTLFSALTAVKAVAGMSPGTPSRTGKPNVIIMFTDDQGTLDANCYGSDDLYTPTMDKLQRRGGFRRDDE